MQMTVVIADILFIKGTIYANASTFLRKEEVLLRGLSLKTKVNLITCSFTITSCKVVTPPHREVFLGVLGRGIHNSCSNKNQVH